MVSRDCINFKYMDCNNNKCGGSKESFSHYLSYLCLDNKYDGAYKENDKDYNNIKKV